MTWRLWFLICSLVFSLCEATHGQCPPGQYCPLQPYGNIQPYQAPRLVQVPKQTTPPPQVVRVFNKSGNTACIGSGTLVDRNDEHGLILSCGHIFSDGQGTTSVLFPNGKEYGAKVLEVDKGGDLSALLIRVPECEPWEIATEAPRRGDAIYSAGYGQQGVYAVNAGTVRGYVSWGNAVSSDALSISGSARQGDSGGPMFDSEHRVVGVLCGTDGNEVDGPCCLRIRKFLERHSRRFGKTPTKPLGPPTIVETPTEAPKPDPRISELEKQLADTEAARKKALDDAAKFASEAEEADGQQKTLKDKLREAEQRAAEALAKVHDAAADSGKAGLPAVEAGVKTVAVGGLTGLLVPVLGPAAPIAANILVGLGGAAVLWGGNMVRKRLSNGSQPAPSRPHAQSGPPYLSPADVCAGPAIHPPTKIIREPAPPAPLSVEERHHNHYVEIPVSKTDEAWARAHQIYADAYPGSFHALKAVERLKEQILKGEPTSLPDR